MWTSLGDSMLTPWALVWIGVALLVSVIGWRHFTLPLTRPSRCSCGTPDLCVVHGGIVGSIQLDPVPPRRKIAIAHRRNGDRRIGNSGD